MPKVYGLRVVGNKDSSKVTLLVKPKGLKKKEKKGIEQPKSFWKIFWEKYMDYLSF